MIAIRILKFLQWSDFSEVPDCNKNLTLRGYLVAMFETSSIQYGRFYRGYVIEFWFLSVFPPLYYFGKQSYTLSSSSQRDLIFFFNFQIYKHLLTTQPYSHISHNSLYSSHNTWRALVDPHRHWRCDTNQISNFDHRTTIFRHLLYSWWSIVVRTLTGLLLEEGQRRYDNGAYSYISHIFLRISHRKSASPSPWKVAINDPMGLLLCCRLQRGFAPESCRNLDCLHTAIACSKM